MNNPSICFVPGITKIQVQCNYYPYCMSSARNNHNTCSVQRIFVLCARNTNVSVIHVLCMRITMVHVLSKKMIFPSIVEKQPREARTT